MSHNLVRLEMALELSNMVWPNESKPLQETPFKLVETLVEITLCGKLFL